MTANSLAWTYHWDKFPYVLLNLVFSVQAAYAAPIIMMSQNRQAAKDRIRDDREFEVNMHSADTVDEILRKVDKMASIMGVPNDIADR